MKTRNFTSLTLLLLATFLCAGTWASAVQVRLKITYNGKGVANNNITIKVGDVTLGTGRTDEGGNVSINVSQLISPAIDVYGAVQTNNGSKTWDVKGWVSLNAEYYGELRFEDVFKEMDIPAGMFAEAWGLTFSTSGGGSNGGSANSGSANSGDNNNTRTAEAREPEVAALKPGYKCAPVSASDLAKYKQSVTNETFDNNKVDVIRRFFSSNCYDASQAKQLISMITFENSRLELAKKGYENCANQGMYLVEVSPALEMSMSRDELRDFIGGYEDSGEEDDEMLTVARPRPDPKPKAAPTPKAEPVPKAAPTPKAEPTPAPMVQDDKISIRTEKGEPFIAYLDGVQLNTESSNDITVPLKSPHGMTIRVKIIFDDKNIPTLEKKVLLTGVSDYYVFIVKLNEKIEWVIKPKL
jgi:Domain of unknown function (DUF4476)